MMRSRHRPHRLLREERGSQTIEFVAIFPLIIFAFLLIWQMALAAYAVVVAEAAARDGARVAAVGGDYAAASKKAAYGLEVQQVTSSSPVSNSFGKEITVQIQVKIPVVKLPFMQDLNLSITADATMPYEEEQVIPSH